MHQKTQVKAKFSAFKATFSLCDNDVILNAFFPVFSRSSIIITCVIDRTIT